MPTKRPIYVDGTPAGHNVVHVTHGGAITGWATGEWAKRYASGHPLVQAVDAPSSGRATPAQAAFMAAIGGSETSFDPKQAYSDKYNQPVKGKPGYNANVAAGGPSYGDYGYYQMNQHQVQEAIKLGVPPDVAKHLNGGGPGGNSSAEQQTEALHQYMMRKYPDYSNFQSGDFEKLRQQASHEWFGLSRDHGKPARDWFYDELNDLGK